MRDRQLISALWFAALILASLTPFAPTATAGERTFVIEMENIQFRPNLIQVDPGDIVTILVFNNDTTGHTLDITEFAVHIGTRTDPLLPGQNQTRTFTADRAGTFWFFCDIPGHASRSGNEWTGMAGRLIVGQTPAPLDLTVAFVAGGVIAAAVIVGLVVWLRRRPPKL